MNALTISTSGGEAMTMTSKQLADLTEKRHDNVKRTIDTLVNQEVIAQPQIEDGGKAANGVVEKLYRIGKRDSYIIVAQLSPEFTARLVDRWQELESAAADPMRVLADPAAMRTLLLGYTEKVIALETKVAEQAPKVQAFDRIATSDGSLCITDAAKTLQVQPRQLTKVLQEKHWVYRRPMGTGWLAYQDRIQAGLLEHKVTTGERGDGHEWSNTQVRITAKGLTKLAESLHQGGLH